MTSGPSDAFGRIWTEPEVLPCVPVAVIVYEPSASGWVGGMLQLPVDVTTACPICTMFDEPDAWANSVTVSPACAVPMKFGRLTFVIPSVDDAPVSEAGFSEPVRAP